jgi:hypothetical protein
MTRNDYLEVVRRARGTLFKIPGVFAVGVGYKVTGGQDTGRLALNVMVKEKKPLASLSRDEVIPSEIEGMPTDVEEGHPPTLIQDTFCKDFDPGVEPDEAKHRPLVGGVRIRGARSVDLERRPSFGTLGCFATSTGDEAGKRVLLTNYHVLEDAIHQLHGPSCTGCTNGDSVGNPNVGDKVATVLRGLDNDQLDAAIAILESGVQFQQDIIKDDDPSGFEAIKGARPRLNQDDPADHNFRVHKRGQTTRITFGEVRVFGADVTIEEPGRVRHKENQIRIDLPSKVQEVATVGLRADGTVTAPSVDFTAADVRVNDLMWTEGPLALGPFRITGIAQHELVVAGTVPDNPSAQVSLFVTPPHFALHGDSGSVMLDDQSRVVGLVWAAFCKRRIGNAWANAIDQVESQLQIKIDTAASIGDTQIARVGPTDARGVLIDTDGRLRPAAARGGEAAVTLRKRVELDLLPMQRGRQIYDLYFRHHMEVRQLLAVNRRVAVVWHRQGGPGIVQSVLDAVRSREVPVPATIGGKSWKERVSLILAVFGEHGSDRLRDDIGRFGRDVESLGGMTYPAFLASLET